MGRSDSPRPGGDVARGAAVSGSQARFVWYELMTTDVEAAKAFYTKVVGWGTQDVSAPGIPYILFTAAGATISGLTDLSDAARQMGAKPSWIGYVGVDDVDAATERVAGLGGAVLVPPQEIPNVSRFSIVTDPQKATLALLKWLKPGRQQPDELDSPGAVGWHELLAADSEKAAAFYDELFGWERVEAEIDAPKTYRLFAAGGQTAGSIFTKPPSLPIPHWLYYFNVADIDAAAKRVKAGGGKILHGPTAVPVGGRMVQCADPQGALFALVGERKLNAPGYFERAAPGDRSPAQSGASSAAAGFTAKWFGPRK